MPYWPSVCGALLSVLLTTAPAAAQAQAQPKAPPKAKATGQRQPITLRVVLPVADAVLKVQGQATNQRGEHRTFVSPALEPGRDYTYTLVAEWKPNNYTTISRTRQVTARAGETVEADLRRAAPANPDKVNIRYVPTPPEVVAAMCRLGRVGKGDVVFDLGCGDGRIVIAAVEQFGADRGVGVDIDPARIRDSQENLRQSKAVGRIEFRRGDVLEDIPDLPSATVVMLYMGEELNRRLRPILQAKLKPGTRVVSHRFTMGDWKPDKTETLTLRGDQYLVHLWTVGGDAKGEAKKP